MVFATFCRTNSALSDILAFHISKQNAGLILRKTSYSHLTLEFFAASPTAAAVASTVGKLIIQFPSRPRLSFPTERHAIDSLCALLVDLDCIEMPDAMHVVQKANSTQVEIREVADIRYISELLGGIARACTEDAEKVAGTTTYVIKRVDDHVLWESCLLPWRRSPHWMIVRVALQSSLTEWEMHPSYGYKIFTTFLLARVLERALEANVAHDVLFTMNAKIAIRVSKLPPAAHSSPIFNYIASQSKSCSVLLGQRWQDIQAAEASPLKWTAPEIEEIEKAKSFSLTNSRAYLLEVYNRSKTLAETSHKFSPSSFEASLPPMPTSVTCQSSPPCIPLRSSGVDLWMVILDVERWVAYDMDDWMSNTPSSEKLEPLRQLIEDYHSLTTSFGDSNPELFSRVFLTQMELWVALDKIVLESIPLLAKYSPELDVTFLEPLLLPTLDQMVRLRAVEKYLQHRRDHVKYPQHSIFEFVNHIDSFPARYFDEDLGGGLRDLRVQIREEARRQLDSTRETWRLLKAKYIRLTGEDSRMSHTYYQSHDRWGDPISVHASRCQKCDLQREIEGLCMDVHEWPLPENDILSRLVVFELRLPKDFGIWRDATFSLARRYTSEAPKTNPPPVPVLCDYPALSIYFEARTTKLTIASTTKSFLVAHYRSQKFPCDEHQVVKDHALRYDLFDNSSESGSWIKPSIFRTMNIRKLCKPSLPSGPYDRLAWTITDTKHTSNMVVARQSQCPAIISCHEWDAFGHLRAGNHLQWRNMMLELVRGTLTLANPAVYLLFRQAAWQAESSLSSEGNDEGCDPRREAHLDLSDAEFGKNVLSVLRARLSNISANWQERWTAATLSMIACRLFSLSANEEVKMDVLSFLASLRRTLSEWMQQVLRLMESEASKLTVEEINELRDRVIQLAVTCRSTYMTKDAIAKILDNSTALTIFIDSAIVLQNIMPISLSSLSSPLRYMVERDVVLAAEVCEPLRAAINSNNVGLDDAIRSNTWCSFRRNAQVPWKLIGDRWMTCETSSGGQTQVCYVHLNLYNGTFLVNGKTIGGLPKDILGHSLFQALFPSQVLYFVSKFCFFS